MRLKTIMTSKTLCIASLFAVTFVAGCAPLDPETGTFVDTATPETSSMSKQINVQKLSPVFVTKFEQGNEQFTDIEKGRLLGFVEAQRVQFGDTLYVELPPFTDSAGINEIRYGAIGGFLEGEGFKIVPKVLKEGLTNSLRVYYTKYVATVDPECAKGWRKPTGNDYENLPLPYMGCATASALAQMIADPKDLIEARQAGGADGERAAISIRKYRLGVQPKSNGAAKKDGGK